MREMRRSSGFGFHFHAVKASTLVDGDGGNSVVEIVTLAHKCFDNAGSGIHGHIDMQTTGNRSKTTCADVQNFNRLVSIACKRKCNCLGIEFAVEDEQRINMGNRARTVRNIQSRQLGALFIQHTIHNHEPLRFQRGQR